MANIIKFPGKFIGETIETATKNLDDAAKVSAKLVDFKTATQALNKQTSKYGGLKASEELLQFKPIKQAMDNLETTVKYSNNVVQFRPTQQAVQTVEQGGKKAGELIDFKTAKEAIETKRYGEKQTAKIYDFQEARNKKLNTNTKTNPEPQTSSSGNGGGGNKNVNNRTNTPEPEGPKNNNNTNNNKTKFNPNDVNNMYQNSKHFNIDDTNKQFTWGDFGNKYFGGITDTYKGTMAGDGFWNSLQAAHKNADGTLRWDRVAGTYAAAAIGSRVISGGGLYKDKYGNTNLPGIPFI